MFIWLYLWCRIHDVNKNIPTREIYDQSISNLLDGVLNGYNSTIIAYGATGCGKTYTYYLDLIIEWSVSKVDKGSLHCLWSIYWEESTIKSILRI